MPEFQNWEQDQDRDTKKTMRQCDFRERDPATKQNRNAFMLPVIFYVCAKERECMRCWLKQTALDDANQNIKSFKL